MNNVVFNLKDLSFSFNSKAVNVLIRKTTIPVVFLCKKNKNFIHKLKLCYIQVIIVFGYRILPMTFLFIFQLRAIGLVVLRGCHTNMTNIYLWHNCQWRGKILFIEVNIMSHTIRTLLSIIQF